MARFGKIVDIVQSALIAQSLARVFALFIPLVMVFIARFALPEGASAQFFLLLTETVAFAAVARLGADVYLPVCGVKDGKVEISPTYRILFHCVSFVLVALTFLPSFGFSIPMALGITALVMQAAMLAEIARARGSYFWFYLMKAPVSYFGALIWAIWMYADIGGLAVFGAMLVLTLALINIRLSNASPEQGQWRGILTDTVLSFVRVVAAWQASFLVRLFGSGDDLEITVFYTRFVILVTFLFSLYNARIANQLRGADQAPTLEGIRKINSAPMKKTLAWAVVSGAGVCVFAAIVDPTLIGVVAVLMAASVITVWFGNLPPIYVGLRQNGLSLAMFAGSIVIFTVTFIVFLGYMDVLWAMALASVIAALLKGAAHHFGLSIAYARAVRANRWNQSA